MNARATMTYCLVIGITVNHRTLALACIIVLVKTGLLYDLKFGENPITYR